MILNKIKLIMFPLLMAMGVAGYSQNAIINGTVTGLDDLPLSGISIRLTGGENVISNARGNFNYSGLTAGDHTLKATAIGYQTYEQTIKLGENEIRSIHITLREAVMDLPVVSISSVTITGGNEGIGELAGSAHYISPKQLQKFNYTDINKTLKMIPGINMQEEDGFGLRPNIGLRGTGVERSSKITIMEDGILMAPAPYASPAAYYFPTIARMQAVEIVKGSSQIKYGPYTTGGAINLISTQIPDQLGGKIYLNAGSFNSKRLHAWVGDSYEHIGFLVEANQYNSDGFKQLDGGGNTGFYKNDYLAKLRFNTAADAKIYQSVTFKAGVVTENSNETYLGLTKEDFEEDPYRRYSSSAMDNMITEQTQFSARYAATFNKYLNLTATAYRNDFARNWYKVDNVKDSSGVSKSIASILDDPDTFASYFDIITGAVNSADDALGVKANNRKYYAQGIETILNFNHTKGNINQNIDAGLRLHQDVMDRFQWLDKYKMEDGIMELTSTGVEGTESNQVVHADALAAYIQYKIKINKLSFSPGIRYENIRMEDKNYGKNDPLRTGIELVESENKYFVFIPGIGVDYKLNKSQNVFAGVNKGFSPAGASEDADPEESINYELGTRFNNKVIKGQFVAFYNDYSNLLGADLAAAGGTGSGDLFNGGEAIAKGIEFDITYDLLGNSNDLFELPLTIAYTYTDAIFQSSFESTFEDWGDVEKGDHLPYLSTHQLATQITLEHRKFSVNVNGKYNSAMRSKAGQGEIPETELINGYFVVDVSAAYNISALITVCGSVTNVSGEEYVVAIRPAGYRPGMPRCFNLGLKAYF